MKPVVHRICISLENPRVPTDSTRSSIPPELMMDRGYWLRTGAPGSPGADSLADTAGLRTIMVGHRRESPGVVLARNVLQAQNATRFQLHGKP